jgi:hypothetical protein
MIISHLILLTVRNVSGNFVEGIKTNILFSTTLLRKSCPSRDNVEKYGAVR